MLLKKWTIMMCALILGTECLNTPLYAARPGGLAMQFSLKPVTVSVSGTVIDKETREPIANAVIRGHITVWMYQGPDFFEKCPYQETMTDAQGKYTLEFLTPLTTTVAMKDEDGLCVDVSAPGYETKPQYVRPNVANEHTTFPDFDFEMQPGKRVAGVVVDQAGLPIAGAVVRVQNSSNSDWNFFGSMGKTVTDEKGGFELWIGTPQGTYEDGNYIGRDPWLCIFKQGIGAGFFWDILTKEDMGTLVLSSDGTITGKVIDVHGNPTENCEISVRGSWCNLIGAVRTDQDGTYTITGIPGDPSIVEFYKRKNNRFRYNNIWGLVEVFAQINPAMSLQDVPQYKIMAKDGETITGPDLIVGAEASVSGRLIASKTALGLGGLMVRLDDKWSNMVEADIEGNFHFVYVSPGKHKLTVYLPHNLRYDRGIGQAAIDVTQGTAIVDVSIPLEELAELRVCYLDMHGNPMPGITAGATWSKSGDGGWTEGTVSDSEGWAVLYLHPDSTQYIRGYDKLRTQIAEIAKEVNPGPAQILEPLQIVMVPATTLQGCLRDDQGQPLVAKSVEFALNFAQGFVKKQQGITDSNGRFQIDRLSPGIVGLSCNIDSVIFDQPLGHVVELEPGQTMDLGDIILENGLDIVETIEDKHAHAMDNAPEVLQAAADLFDKIRHADYEPFVKEKCDWQKFPLWGIYQTYTRFDILVPWISKTFKDNPIVDVELRDVYINTQVISGKTGLPTVPYKLTLKDGAFLQGDLPFEYNFDGDKGHWHGMQGIDWHLQDSPFSK